MFLLKISGIQKLLSEKNNVNLFSLFAHVVGSRRKELPPESKPLLNNNKKNKNNYNSV